MTTPLASAASSPAPVSFNPNSSAAPAAPAAADAAGSQDRFLKLLVAQLSNQDPMNPMDNAQMTSQIAQINTVTGIQQLNETMKSVAAQMAATQLLQSGSLVGREVLTEGNRLTLDTKGQTALGAVDLAGAASNVTIQVTTAGGRVIDSVPLGALGAGQHGFTLDASAWPAATPLQFSVVASNGAAAVAGSPLARDKVIGVSSGANGLVLNLQNAGSVAYGGVRSIL